jgi:Ca2+-binding EF-hand superfamily protein
MHSLKWSNSLFQSAQAHVDDIGPKGIVGHNSSDGKEPSERIAQYCQWSGALGENIAYGCVDAEDIVVSLLVDDGVLARGQRLNIMKRDHNFAGIALGKHAEYGFVCVIVFVEEIKNEEDQEVVNDQSVEIKNLRWQLRKMKTIEAYETFDIRNYEKPGLTQEKLIEIKEVFDFFECDDLGKIDTHEVRSAIEEQEIEISDLSAFQRYLDQKHQGEMVDFDEFLEIMTGQSSVSFNLSKTEPSIAKISLPPVFKPKKQFDLSDFDNSILNSECIYELKEYFDAVDSKSSGFIDSMALKSFIEVKGINGSMSDIIQVLNNLEGESLEQVTFSKLLEKVEKAASFKKTLLKKPKFDTKPYERDDLGYDEILELKEAFDMFDHSGSGIINPNDLKHAMETQGFKTRNPTIFHLICSLPSHGVENVNFEEFLDMATNPDPFESSESEVKKLFEIFDVEKTGYIELKNLRKIARELGESLNEKEIVDLFSQSDLDKDGKVSFQDFFSVMNQQKFNYF